VGLFGRKDEQEAVAAAPAAPVVPLHPSLAGLDAFAAASLGELGTGVLLAGVAPGVGPELNRLTDDDVRSRVKSAVCGADGLPDAAKRYDDANLYSVVREGLQVLEHSLLIEMWPMGSIWQITTTRRGHAAIAAPDPASFMLVPD